MKIFPSVMAKNQKEMNSLFDKLEGVASELHLDVADGKFVPNTSLWFPFRLSSKFRYNVHLMVKDPISWIKKNGHRVDDCYAQIETVNLEKFIFFMRDRRKKVALALKPETKVASLKKHIMEIDAVLILTVHPGFYGAKFLKAPLKKIKQIKILNPDIKVLVDGGMSPETIKLAKAADSVVSGSFIAKSNNPGKAIKELERAG